MLQRQPLCSGADAATCGVLTRTAAANRAGRMRPMNQLERDLKSRPVWNCDAKSKSVAFTAEGGGPDDASLVAVSAKMKGKRRRL